MRVDESVLKSILTRRHTVEGLASLEAAVVRAVRATPNGRLECGPYTATVDNNGYLVIVKKPRPMRHNDDADQLKMTL